MTTIRYEGNYRRDVNVVVCVSFPNGEYAGIIEVPIPFATLQPLTNAQRRTTAVLAVRDYITGTLQPFVVGLNPGDTTDV